jgi:hypothetical protein
MWQGASNNNRMKVSKLAFIALYIGLDAMIIIVTDSWPIFFSYFEDKNSN